MEDEFKHLVRISRKDVDGNKTVEYALTDIKGVGFCAKEFDTIRSNIEIMINDVPTKKHVLQWYLQTNKGQVAHTNDEISKVEKMLEELDNR